MDAPFTKVLITFLAPWVDGEPFRACYKQAAAEMRREWRRFTEPALRCRRGKAYWKWK